MLPGNFPLPADNILISKFKRLVVSQKNKRKYPEIAEKPFFTRQLSTFLAPTTADDQSFSDETILQQEQQQQLDFFKNQTLHLQSQLDNVMKEKTKMEQQNKILSVQVSNLKSKLSEVSDTLLTTEKKILI